MYICIHVWLSVGQLSGTTVPGKGAACSHGQLDDDNDNDNNNNDNNDNNKYNNYHKKTIYKLYRIMNII